MMGNLEKPAANGNEFLPVCLTLTAYENDNILSEEHFKNLKTKRDFFFTRTVNLCPNIEFYLMTQSL